MIGAISALVDSIDKQFSMFMGENICNKVDLFDKAIIEEASNHCGKRGWNQIKAVTSCSTHKIHQQETDG